MSLSPQDWLFCVTVASSVLWLREISKVAAGVLRKAGGQSPDPLFSGVTGLSDRGAQERSYAPGSSVSNAASTQSRTYLPWAVRLRNLWSISVLITTTHVS